MSDVATRLRAFLLSDATLQQYVGDRVHQAHVPETSDGDFIYFAREAMEPHRVLDTGVIAPLVNRFSLEIISSDLDRAQAIAATVRSKLDGYRGTFGDGTTQGIFVDDHNDDYVPRAIYGDEGKHVAAFSVEVY